MPVFDKWRAQIAVFCDKAIQGKLTLNELYQQWPNELQKSKLASGIYEDIEEGVQHFPGKLFSGKPDYETWKSSEMYAKLYLDKKLLASDGSEDELVKVREAIRQSNLLTVEMVDAKLDALKRKEK
ncbi:MAG: hypothetical protein E6K68_02065 [Nitrospirae bacterium]|nr:MAG: hypothetical protein E6K68_02065 [Nitrospirota bacterium]